MRQFVSSTSPDKKGLIQVSGKDYRYFKQVLRLVPGDMLCVRIPDGSLINTTVCKIDENKKTVVLQICSGQISEEKLEHQSEYIPETEFILFQFAAKGQKMDLIIRQAAECGVSKIIPVNGEFSQSGSTEKNFRNERLMRIIKEARQQSGSPVATEVTDLMTVEQVCSLWKELSEGQDDCFACVLYERSEKTVSLHKALGIYKKVKKCAIICGAEGGISPAEIDSFVEAGIVPVHFETNILRCETAALYGTACLQNAVAEKNLWQLKE